MKTTGLITRRRAIIAGLASVGGFALALPEKPAAHLRQPAAHGRLLHLRRAAGAARPSAGEGVQPQGRHFVSRDGHDGSRRHRESGARETR